ncbi:hypothetical protein [Halocatena marina]|uniref:hypothetical protein n=1 Tax=Halocatena marina TaxID=2934937 RepID=UPI00200C4F97|nr:hypothetical protein [Halocatena marina]
MNLPVMQFRNRMGQRVNPSMVENRSAVSTAELSHVVDVGDSVWCRPCQCLDCTHAEQVERVLTAAGIGNEEANGAWELPQITRITNYRAVGETISGCWFENEARLRYHEQTDGRVSRVVFAPEDSRTPAATTPLPDANSAATCLVKALAEYSDYRRNGDYSGLKRERPELAIVAGGTKRTD